MPDVVRGIVNKKREVGSDGNETVFYKVKLQAGGDKWLPVGAAELDEKHVQNFEKKRKAKKAGSEVAKRKKPNPSNNDPVKADDLFDQDDAACTMAAERDGLRLGDPVRVKDGGDSSRQLGGCGPSDHPASPRLQPRHPAFHFSLLSFWCRTMSSSDLRNP